MNREHKTDAECQQAERYINELMRERDEALADAERLEVERDRLREALEEIRDLAINESHVAIPAARAIAREALAGTEDE